MSTYAIIDIQYILPRKHVYTWHCVTICVWSYRTGIISLKSSFTIRCDFIIFLHFSSRVIYKVWKKGSDLLNKRWKTASYFNWIWIISPKLIVCLSVSCICISVAVVSKSWLFFLTSTLPSSSMCSPVVTFTGLSITASPWLIMSPWINYMYDVSCLSLGLNLNSNLDSNMIRYGFTDTWYTLLTHWGRVTYICVTKLTTIVSDIG